VCTPVAEAECRCRRYLYLTITKKDARFIQASFAIPESRQLTVRVSICSLHRWRREQMKSNVIFSPSTNILCFSLRDQTDLRGGLPSPAAVTWLELLFSSLQYGSPISCKKIQWPADFSHRLHG
jgi:hypothetical protein